MSRLPFVSSSSYERETPQSKLSVSRLVGCRIELGASSTRTLYPGGVVAVFVPKHLGHTHRIIPLPKEPDHAQPNYTFREGLICATASSTKLSVPKTVSRSPV